MTVNSLEFVRHGDKEHSVFFEENLVRLLEERDKLGLTDMIHEIDALAASIALLSRALIDSFYVADESAHLLDSPRRWWMPSTPPPERMPVTGLAVR